VPGSLGYPVPIDNTDREGARFRVGPPRAGPRDSPCGARDVSAAKVESGAVLSEGRPRVLLYREAGSGYLENAMARIYTRGGDEGETSLFGGERVPKNHPRVRAYGEVDELGSAVGVALSGLDPGWDIARTLRSIQHQLFRVGGALADPAGKTKVVPPGAEETAALERAIDLLEEQLPELKRFILPGGTAAGAHLHLARTVCRRAERSVVDLVERGESVPAGIIVYLNRLSDYLFVAARAANRRAGVEEEPWDPER